MGIAEPFDHRGNAPFAAGALPVSLDDEEADLGSCETHDFGSLLGMAGKKRKKQPVLLLDPAEAEAAARDFQLVAANDFANGEMVFGHDDLIGADDVDTDAGELAEAEDLEEAAEHDLVEPRFGLVGAEPKTRSDDGDWPSFDDRVELGERAADDFAESDLLPECEEAFAAEPVEPSEGGEPSEFSPHPVDGWDATDDAQIVEEPACGSEADGIAPPATLAASALAVCDPPPPSPPRHSHGHRLRAGLVPPTTPTSPMGRVFALVRRIGARLRRGWQ